MNKKPGNWLFLKKNLSWMDKPELRRQLPFLIRLFGTYARFWFKITQSDYLRGGRKLFMVISDVNHLLFRLNYLTVNLPGYNVCVDLKDPRFLHVINELTKPDSVLNILELLLKEGDTFIDVGANHGSFSIVAGKLVGKDGLVVAIEAQPRLIFALRKSMELNSIAPFQIIQTAVGDKEGVADFFIPSDTSGSAGVFAGHSAHYRHHTARVKMSRMDNLVDWRKFSGNIVVKLDIEGSEYAFLKGAKEMISSLKPILVMEVNPDSMKASGTSEDKMISILKEVGYSYFSYLKRPDIKHALIKLNLEKFSNIILYAD